MIGSDAPTATGVLREPVRASTLAVARPRPQLLRTDWAELGGTWGFAHDDEDAGEREGWASSGQRFGRTIVVPFPPESPASGIGDDRLHDIVWYQRDVTWEEVLAAGFDPARPLLHLHFGAVDYRASVWVNGALVGTHEGGHTPFSFDITTTLIAGATQSIVVRAEDRAADVEQPRGKQDWQEDAHIIWYRRTTGIWQQVWLEATPALFVEQLHLTPDISAGLVRYEVNLNRPPAPGTRLRIRLLHGDDTIADLDTAVGTQRPSGTVTIPRLGNGQDRERILWSPESPTLIDAYITVAPAAAPDGTPDTVSSYLGLRSVSVRDGSFLLNYRPLVLRSVLSQGYWPETHLAAPTEEALRAEAELIQSLGFNAARVHQKIEDPRFLYWADRLGLLVWAEVPAAYVFSATAVERLTREWMRAIDRDRSHPCVVTWVPMNESWGIQDVAHSAAQRAFASGLAQLTRALDPTRPVISNDGWEHLESDLLTVHDYDDDPDTVRARYLDAAARNALRAGIGPCGRPMVLTTSLREDAPLMLTEFGGIEFVADPSESAEDSWGYSTAESADQFEGRLRALYRALQASTVLAGTCYTQLTDTLQEANGLCTEDRRPKLDAGTIRAIVTGSADTA